MTKRASLWDKRRAVKHTAHDLAGKKNVLYVSLGFKKVGGEKTGEAAAVVHVRKKERVRGAHSIPKTVPVRNARGKIVGEMPTDVVEVAGPAKLFGLQSGMSIRAALSGVCGLPFSRNGKRCFLTNAHVVRDVLHGGRFVKVFIVNPKTGESRYGGDVLHATPLLPDGANTLDAAIVEVLDAVPIDEWAIWGMPGMAKAGPGLKLLDERTYWFIARGKRVRCSDAHFIPAPTTAQLENGPVFAFKNFFELTTDRNAARGGISGALLWRQDRDQITACGLVFGGIAESDCVYVFPMATVWRWVMAMMD